MKDRFVLEDGYSDGIGEIIASLGDKRVKYFSILHSGAQKARYYGIEKSHGQFIIFLDDHSRVVLNGEEDYINASYIDVLFRFFNFCFFRV